MNYRIAPKSSSSRGADELNTKASKGDGAIKNALPWTSSCWPLGQMRRWPDSWYSICTCRTEHAMTVISSFTYLDSTSMFDHFSARFAIMECEAPKKTSFSTVMILQRQRSRKNHYSRESGFHESNSSSIIQQVEAKSRYPVRKGRLSLASNIGLDSENFVNL